MQGWIVAGAWSFAVVFAVVVLGFVAYEVSWKARRLTADRDRLNLLVSELQDVAADLQNAGERARAMTARPAAHPQNHR
jgi:hypothetical protein